MDWLVINVRYIHCIYIYICMYVCMYVCIVELVRYEFDHQCSPFSSTIYRLRTTRNISSVSIVMSTEVLMQLASSSGHVSPNHQ